MDFSVDVEKLLPRLCCRTFETSLLLDESISDELPYSGEGAFLSFDLWFCQ